MRGVLISIKPKWCELIVSDKKTIEIRKTRPKLETPFKCYIYCTNYNVAYNPKKLLWKKDSSGFTWILNGKVIGEFVCDDCSTLTKSHYSHVEKYACLSIDDLLTYMGITGRELQYTDNCFGWHISDLKIYDRPKYLKNFRHICSNDLYCESCAMFSEYNGYCGNISLRLKRPPRSWCYVEEV